jgi:hypothetical protein
MLILVRGDVKALQAFPGGPQAAGALPSSMTGKCAYLGFISFNIIPM